MTLNARNLLPITFLACFTCLASSERFACGQKANFGSQNVLGTRVAAESLTSIGDRFETAADGFIETPSRPQGIPGDLEAEWVTESDFGYRRLGTGLAFPLLFLKREGGPPPMMRLGFNHTDLNFSDRFDLPGDLYEVSFGVSGVHVFNDRWAVRSILGMDFATDGENRSRDAWRFRGGAFAIYEMNPRLKLSFGAIALGRQDLPVVPALGAIWQPNDRTRCDLILPRPKVSYMLTDDGNRQNWIYTGIGLEGNTWGYETPTGQDRQLSYGDWRWTLGWESRPSAPAGVPFVLGRKYSAEIGYAFSRDIELDNEANEISLPSSFLVRISTRY